MKRVINLTENELIDLIKVVVEQEEQYTEMDYFEVFITYFKKWLIEEHKEDLEKYPFSYLLRKYSKQFVKEVLEQKLDDYEEDDDEYSIDRWNMERFAKILLQKGKVKIPTLRKEEKFTEKHKKQIDYFLGTLQLPPYCSVKLIEERPYDVKVQLVIDYPEMLKDSNETTWTSNKVEDKLRKFLQNYLGVEFGNPTYGELNLSYEKSERRNLEKWIKEVLNKKIKKELKSLPNSNIVKSIQFNPYDYKGDIKIVYKGGDSWRKVAQDYKNAVQTYLIQLGYPEKRIRVTNA